MEIEWLTPILSDPARLKREESKRHKLCQETSVPKPLVPEYVEAGWEVAREFKTRTRLRRPWPHEERLENQAWCLFYLLGYPEISSGRSFKVRIERKGAKPLTKQIDVLAKDDETVLVAECKSSSQVGRRSLQKDIEEFANLKGPISKAINEHYGQDPKLKIIWLFVTHNIVWSNPDKERAAGANIHIITERELRYYLQIADHLRSAARYQFLAEFLKNKQIPGMENVRVPAVRGRLGGRNFYSFVSTPRQMLKIAFVNHRSLNDPDGAPSYQRLVSRSRLKQISRFLKGGGYFPTNILVNFPEKCRFERIAKDDDTNVTFGHLYLPSRYRSAWIIDGQHRLYGYAPLSDAELDQNIMVVAFEEMDATEEANLFVTINHEQKSVPKNLLDDLEGELKWGSKRPSERVGAISARLITLLNGDIGEPLYSRVTQQGIPATELTCLTVPELKRGLKRSGLVGSVVMRGKEYQPGPLSDTTDLLTLDRARSALNAYLGQIADANPTLWELGRRGLLCTNTAMQAYLQLLASVIEHMQAEKKLNPRHLEPLQLVSEIGEYIQPVLDWLSGAVENTMSENFKVPFGSGGPPEYYFRLCRLINATHPQFAPPDFPEWLEAKSEQRVEDAEQQLKELNILIQRFIFDRFKGIYGLEGDAYWHKGVLDKEIRTRAYKKSLDSADDDRLALENYLDFIEYKKIVENREHWQVFKPVFDIPELDERGLSKNLKWMERINELRRVQAHPTESKSYKLDDLDYIAHIHREFLDRLDTFERSRAADRIVAS
ncbi:MAG: DGQHR domain-containing protein [Coriobacteriia bacterium]|nr:DGQHR domain-containing protein [Coriobacteriia bacterium]